MVNNSQLICRNCSSKLPNNVRFCTKCGKKIEENKDMLPPQTERASKIEDYPNTNASYQKPHNQPIDDPVESLRESGKDFMRDIGGFLNKSSASSRSRAKYCPNCSAALPHNVRFCTKCGNPVEQKPRAEHDSVQTTNVEEKTGYDEIEQLEYLEKLAGLRDKGIISDEEFEKKKKDILKI